MQIQDFKHKNLKDADKNKRVIEIKKWFNQQLFKGIEKLDGGDITYINALLDQLLCKHKQAKKGFKSISKKICDIPSQSDFCKTSVVIKAT